MVIMAGIFHCTLRFLVMLLKKDEKGAWCTSKREEESMYKIESVKETKGAVKKKFCVQLGTEDVGGNGGRFKVRILYVGKRRG